jgi:hypothetical protein
LAESDASECTSDHEYPEGTEEIRVLIDCLYELVPYFETIPTSPYGDRCRVGGQKRPVQKVHNEFAQEWEPDKKILLEAFGSENELLVESLAKKIIIDARDSRDREHCPHRPFGRASRTVAGIRSQP